MSINNLKSRIQNRDACIAVIGLGYVGLPLVIRFSEEGFRVIGFDIDEEKIEKLNKGESYLRHISADAVEAVANNGFSATSDWKRISDCDVILICVPSDYRRIGSFAYPVKCDIYHV